MVSRTASSQSPLKASPRFILADYEGVVGPGADDVKAGLLARVNRVEFISELTGVRREDALEHGRALARQHGTDSYEYVFPHFLGIPLKEYVERVFTPEVLNLFRSELALATELGATLRKIGVPKAILSNTAEGYVRAGLEAQGLLGHFGHVVAAEQLDTVPTTKPREAAYLKALEITGFDPQHTVYLDDRVQNLVVPHQLGMTTVHIGPLANEERNENVDYKIATLNDALLFLFKEAFHG